MKLFNRLSGVILILIASASFNARAGGVSDGGGDNLSFDSGSAWFLADAPVRYCLEVAPNFGPSQQEIIATLEKVFQTWKDYINKKQIHRADYDVAKGQYLALNYSLMSPCDGTEELKFYFGVLNDEVKKAKAVFENPSAFVHRVSHDMKTGRSKGFVWVAPPKSVYPGANFPNWTTPYTLNGILLHEMGHVLGCGHVSGTIMESDMTPNLQMAESPAFLDRAKVLLTHVDDIRELILDESYFDFEGAFGNPYDQAGQKILFRLFAKRDPVGKIHAKFSLVAGTGFSFKIYDDSGAVNFSPKFNFDNDARFKDSVELFKVMRATSDPQTGVVSDGTGYNSLGSVRFGSVALPDGKVLTLTLDRNSSSPVASPLAMYYVNEGKREVVFTANVDGIN